jgi:hypothetical protein
MSYIIPSGTTSKSINILIKKADGSPKTGLVFNTVGLKAYYIRQTDWVSTQITLANLTNLTDPWTSGGFKEIDATNKSGEYRIDLPNAMIASGADFTTLTIDGTDFNIEGYIINLDPIPANIKKLNDVVQSAINMEKAFSTLKARLVDTTTFSPAHSAPNTIFESTFVTSTPDRYNGRLITFIGGALDGEQSNIVDYEFTNGKGRLTVTGLTLLPVNNQEFIVH